MNPDGEHLVCGLISIPTIYAFIATVWAILLVKNVMRALLSWDKTTIVQILFIAVALVKIVFAALASAQWKQISKVGVYQHDALMLFTAIIGALFYLGYFGLMFLLSSGWAVTRKNIITDKIAFIISKYLIIIILNNILIVYD